MSAGGGLALSFPYPRTNPIDFCKVFPTEDSRIVELQKQANALRSEMVAALVEQDSEKVCSIYTLAVLKKLLTCFSPQILKAIDEYLPYCLGIDRYVQDSIEKVGKRPLNPNLQFEWTSVFSRRTGTFFTFYTLKFEFVMVYTCRMIAEGNIAAALLDSVTAPAEYENAAKGALARIKSAAGIATFINDNVLPLGESLPYKRPPEVDGRARSPMNAHTLAGSERFLPSDHPPLQGDNLTRLSQAAADAYVLESARHSRLQRSRQQSRE
eukprot:745690-Hanusia_phi.AAC.1